MARSTGPATSRPPPKPPNRSPGADCEPCDSTLVARRGNLVLARWRHASGKSDGSGRGRTDGCTGGGHRGVSRRVSGPGSAGVPCGVDLGGRRLYLLVRRVPQSGDDRRSAHQRRGGRVRCAARRSVPAGPRASPRLGQLPAGHRRRHDPLRLSVPPVVRSAHGSAALHGVDIGRLGPVSRSSVASTVVVSTPATSPRSAATAVTMARALHRACATNPRSDAWPHRNENSRVSTVATRPTWGVSVASASRPLANGARCDAFDPCQSGNCPNAFGQPRPTERAPCRNGSGARRSLSASTGSATKSAARVNRVHAAAARSRAWTMSAATSTPPNAAGHSCRCDTAARRRQHDDGRRACYVRRL